MSKKFNLNVICFYCKKLGHMQPNCPTAPYCSFCKTKGHSFNECRKKSKSLNTQSSNKKSNAILISSLLSSNNMINIPPNKLNYQNQVNQPCPSIIDQTVIQPLLKSKSIIKKYKNKQYLKSLFTPLKIYLEEKVDKLELQEIEQKMMSMVE